MWAYLSNRTDYIHYILRHAAVINADFGLHRVTAMRVAYRSELWFFPSIDKIQNSPPDLGRSRAERRFLSQRVAI